MCGSVIGPQVSRAEGAASRIATPSHGGVTAGTHEFPLALRNSARFAHTRYRARYRHLPFYI